MADIFISYAHEDRDTAERLAHALEAEGWSVWWDPRLRTGVEYRPAIDSELKVTGCVIVLWSTHSVMSTFVCDEAQVGQRRGVLVPVAIDAGVEGALGFRSLHTAQLVGWDGNTASPDFRRLAADIGQLLKPAKAARKGRAAAPRPASAPPAAPMPQPTPAPVPDPGWPHWRVAWVAAGAALGGALIWGGGGETPAPPPPTTATAPRVVTLATAVPRPPSPASPASQPLQGLTLAGLLAFDKTALDFGPIARRSDVAARPLQLTVRNLIGTTRTLKLVGSGPDVAAFTLDAPLCAKADGGWRVEKSCQFSVNFTPRHEGPHSARFEVIADGRPSGQAVQLGGNGAAPASAGLWAIGNTLTLDTVRCEAGKVTLGGRMSGHSGNYLEVEPGGLGARPSCSAWTGKHQRNALTTTCMRLQADPESSTWTMSAQPWLLREPETQARAWLRREVPGQNAVQTVVYVEAPLNCRR